MTYFGGKCIFSCDFLFFMTDETVCFKWQVSMLKTFTCSNLFPLCTTPHAWIHCLYVLHFPARINILWAKCQQWLERLYQAEETKIQSRCIDLLYKVVCDIWCTVSLVKSLWKGISIHLTFSYCSLYSILEQ